jgi:hypothetical protein
MADNKIAHGSSAAVTISPASLANDANHLAGRESSEIDNTTNKYLDYLISGMLTTGTSPVADTEMRVSVVGLMNDTTYPDVFDGTDSAETVSSQGTAAAILKRVATIVVLNTNDKTYWFGPVSVASLFGGVLPKKFSVFVTNGTNVALNATGGNHAIYVTPVYQTIA